MKRIANNAILAIGATVFGTGINISPWDLPTWILLAGVLLGILCCNIPDKQKKEKTEE